MVSDLLPDVGGSASPGPLVKTASVPAADSVIKALWAAGDGSTHALEAAVDSRDLFEIVGSESPLHRGPVPVRVAAPIWTAISHPCLDGSLTLIADDSPPATPPASRLAKHSARFAAHSGCFRTTPPDSDTVASGRTIGSVGA